MTIASLGIELTGHGGFDRGAASLSKFRAESERVEASTARMRDEIQRTATVSGRLFNAKFNADAREYARAVDSTNVKLSGFEAIAARAAMQAEYLTRQIEQMSAHDIRNTEIQEYGRELDALRAKFNPLFAASKQYEASLEEINRAHTLGAISAQEQSAAIMRLDAQYEAAARAANGLAAANKSMAGSFHTTNLLFQMQDIGMMTGLGQNPLAIMLQQGPQITGIFHQIGNGRQIVQSLGAAFMGLINPVSLATIAVIGLGTAGVQALMGMAESWGPTRRTMEEHSQWLSELLAGYDDLRGAVSDYIADAARLPASIARLQIGEGLSADIDRLAELQAALDDFRVRENAFIDVYGINEQLDALRQLHQQFGNNIIDAETLGRRMQLIALNPSLHGDVRNAAQSVVDMVIEMGALEARIGGATMAMEGLSDEALVAATRMANLRASFDMLGTGDFTIPGLEDALRAPQEALDRLEGMIPDIRTGQQRALEELNLALGSQSEEVRAQAQAAYELYLRNNTILEERRQAEAAARAGGRGFDQWQTANDNFQQRIDQMRLEIDLMGQSTYEIARQQAAFDLLNQARQAGVPINDALIGQINSMSAEYAALTVEMERQAAEMQRIEEQINFYRGTFNQFFLTFSQGLREGESAWQSFGNAAVNALNSIADRALSMAANGIFDMLLGAVSGTVMGGFTAPTSFVLGGYYPAFPGYADGTSFAPGGLAWVGERGPELVKLPRGSQVIPNHAIAANGYGSNDNSVHLNITNQINVSPGTSADVAPAIAREVTKELKRQLPDAIERHNRNPYRRAG